MELGCAQPQAWPYFTSAEERKKIRACLQENHLRISSMLPAPGGGPGGNIASANLAEREWTKQYWKDCIDMGLELDDCKTLLCVCGWYIYGTRKRHAWQWARDAIGEVADYAAKSGVTLMLEPTATDSNVVEGCDDAIMMMEDIGRECSGRDHRKIVYSLKTMERDMKNDQHLRETVSDIIKNVKA